MLLETLCTRPLASARPWHLCNGSPQRLCAERGPCHEGMVGRADARWTSRDRQHGV
jgi:hypothetical protein